MLIEFNKETDIGAAPCIDRLIRITDDKQIVMITADRIHQFILQRVNILEFVDHDVFQALLPFDSDLIMHFKDVQSKTDQIVVIKTEAFLFLIQISVEQNIVDRFCFHVFLMKFIQRHLDHIQEIARFIFAFAHFKHISGVRICFITQ